MEIDKDNLIEFIAWLLDHLKRCQAELIAHQSVFYLLKTTGQFPELDQFLEQARAHPPASIEKRFQDTLDTVVQHVSELAGNQAALDFLRRWNPTGSAQ